MEDPWGSSPWADEVQLPDSIKTKEDVPRPPIPGRAPKLGVDGKISSPWGDDNDNDGFGFGDWAALSEEPQVTFGLDGAEDDWGRHSAETGDSTNGHSNAFSMVWDAQHTVDKTDSSSLDPSLFPRGSDPLRQPLPDQWASDVQDEGPEDEVKQALQETTDVLEDGSDHNTTMLDHEMETSSEPQTAQASSEALVPEPESADEETPTIGDSIEVDIASLDVEAKGVAEKPAEGQRGSSSQDSYPVSRPSSSPSERSHHDELLQESPRTSFDEEPKPNRPQSPRKLSTKVQELVQHFDTLAEKEDPETVNSRTSSAQGTHVQEETEADDGEIGEDEDFEDFEEGQSDDEGLELEVAQALAPDATQSLVTETSQHSRNSSLKNALSKDYGVVKFKVEPSILDDIYSSDIPDPTSETIFIPDSIPFDSFSSTEQRKTWYRVSRYGTMRKHNSGNDENYIRVGWKPSTVRDDTLKIVSRWIEEDRISGRVVLGGGSRGSTVFGWNDPKAPAVPLSDVFAKHGKKMSNENTAVEPVPEVPREWPKGLVRDHSTSKARSLPSEPRRRSSIKSTSVPAPPEFSSGSVAPIANFGWNAASGAVQKAEDSSSSSGMGVAAVVSGSVPISCFTSPPRTSMSLSRPLSSSSPSKHDAIHQSPAVPAIDAEPPIPSAQKSVPIPSLSILNTVNDDDDWGEMVSIPVTPTVPVLPPLKGLRYKKSQSFGGTSTNFSTQGSSNEWNDGQLETSQRSRTSFDEALVPQVLGSTTNSVLVTSHVDLLSAPVNSFPNPTPAPPEATSSTLDPWASADFSFFETTPAPTPAPKPIPLPTSRAAGPKGVQFNPSPPSSRSNHKTREEMEHDRIVQSVVRGLPDLSYMLRK